MVLELKQLFGVLSKITAADFAMAVISEDFNSLSKLPGIGKKTAQRIVIEIKDKINTNDAIASTKEVMTNIKEVEKLNDVSEALNILGYTNRDIMAISENLDLSKSIDLIIKDALKLLA